MKEPDRKILKNFVADDEPTTLDLFRKVLCPEADKNKKFSEMEALGDDLFGANAVSDSLAFFDIVTCKQAEEAVYAVAASIKEEQPFSRTQTGCPSAI